MKLHLCFPTLNSFDTLLQAVESANAGTIVPDTIAVIDNSCGKFIEYLEDKQVPSNLIVIRPSTNLGVAESWNAFMQTFEDFIVISNDDVVFEANTLETLVGAAMSKPAFGILYPKSPTENAYSCFLLRKWLWEKVGPFDGRFYPAYFEDNDWDLRRRLADEDILCVENCTYIHVGSSTIKKFTQDEMNAHHVAFRKNRAYYLRKWGGEPHMEMYKVPFDGRLQQP